MMFEDFNFKKIKAVRKQCWTYKSDGNTPIKVGKNIYPLEKIFDNDTLKGFFIQIISNKYGPHSYIMWNDLGNSCVRYNAIDPYLYLEQVQEQVCDWLKYRGLEGFKRRLHILEITDKWVGNTEICALVDNGEVELAAHYQEYHDKVKEEYEKAQTEVRRLLNI